MSRSSKDRCADDLDIPADRGDDSVRRGTHAHDRILVVAGNLPPVRGGAGVVHSSLAAAADGAVVVLASSLDYVDGLPIAGWREHHRDMPFAVHRIPLLAARPSPETCRRVVLIENGVDLDRFRAAPRAPALVDRYGLEGRLVSVTVCRLLAKKGIDQVLRAFARLYAQDRALHFLVVGEGPMRPR